MDYVALASVITSGIVAVSVIIVPFIADYLKAKREKRAADVEKVHSATAEVLKALSLFVAGETLSASALLKSYYVWESIVSLHSTGDEFKQLKHLRADVEGARDRQQETPFYEGSPKLVAQVLEIAEIVSRRL